MLISKRLYRKYEPLIMLRNTISIRGECRNKMALMFLCANNGHFEVAMVDSSPQKIYFLKFIK